MQILFDAELIMSEAFSASWCIIALLSYFVYRYFFQKVQSLPPGPKPLPIIGNARDLPPAGALEYEHWLEHKDTYGPISSVTVLGMTLVIIHDKKSAHDLLEQNSSKTSGRPEMVFAHELCGYEFIIFQPYGSEYRHWRKIIHQELGTEVKSAQFEDIQEVEIKRQLVRTLKEPENWLSHLKTTTGATTLKMTYGYAVEPHKPDPLINMIETSLGGFSIATVPLAWTVDILPFLRHLPENFPGVTFQKKARELKALLNAAANKPYQFVQRQMENCDYRDSYVSRLIRQYTPKGVEDAKLSQQDERAILWTAATFYGAADTTVITLTAFTLAMILNPQVQCKAQEEIDAVVGTDRLPTFKDRAMLPYINALVKECLRSWPIAPMGFPHTTDETIEYNGLHIPKGAYLLPAVWWFLHDPNVYANPELFDPERFLSPRNEPDPSSEAFGYGRRKCPGKFLADSGVFLNIAQSLATFSFNKALDKDGNKIDVEAKIKPGVLSYASDFQFKITPRSQKHVDLIRQVEVDHPWEASDAELLES